MEVRVGWLTSYSLFVLLFQSPPTHRIWSGIMLGESYSFFFFFSPEWVLHATQPTHKHKSMKWHLLSLKMHSIAANLPWNLVKVSQSCIIRTFFFFVLDDHLSLQRRQMQRLQLELANVTFSKALKTFQLMFIISYDVPVWLSCRAFIMLFPFCCLIWPAEAKAGCCNVFHGLSRSQMLNISEQISLTVPS